MNTLDQPLSAAHSNHALRAQRLERQRQVRRLQVEEQIDDAKVRVDQARNRLDGATQRLASLESELTELQSPEVAR